MLFGLYPVYSVEGNIKSREKFWKTMILAFTDDEMKKLLQQVRTKSGKKDRFFYIAFNALSEVLGTRGFPERLDLTHHLLPLRKDDLLRELE